MQTFEVLTPVGGLPREVRQVSREMHCVLAGAAADLQYAARMCEGVREDREYGRFIALGGF